MSGGIVFVKLIAAWFLHYKDSAVHKLNELRVARVMSGLTFPFHGNVKVNKPRRYRHPNE